MILVQSPTGNILVNEQNGVVLDEQALRSMARQTALLSGLNPDAFEAQIAATTGFDPANMRSAAGAFDPQAYFASAVSPGGGPGPRAEDNPQQGSPRVVPNTPGGGTAPYATGGQPIGSATAQPPPGGDALLPGGYTTPEQRQAELALLQAQIAKLTDPIAKATAEAQLRQILAQTANIGAGTGASAGASIINNQNSVAEQARQYNETLAYNKAVNDQRAAADAAKNTQSAAQSAASLDLQRGNTLLGLGSRPETLIRYLYALRGQQGPQQLGGVAPALPGYPGVNALPLGGDPNAGIPYRASSPVSSAAGGPSTPPALTGAPNPLTMGTPAQNAFAQQNAANQTAANPSLAAQFRTTPTAPAPGVDPWASTRPGGVALPSLPSAAVTQQPSVFQTAAGPVSRSDAQAPGVLSLNGGAMPVGSYSAPFNLPPSTSPSPFVTTSFEKTQGGEIIDHGQQQMQRPDKASGVAGDKYWESYGQGGVIPEKVVGVGQDSGQTYEFGEKGTEAVMSNDMLQKLMAVAGKVDFHQKGADGKSSRITMTLNGPPKLDMPKKSDTPMGKTNSYAAGGTIGYSGGKNDYNPRVFNPPNLSGIVGQGFNTPGIPLPPQVNMLTGGGTSLIPSAQTLSHALPSEVGAYSGFLTDEAGVQPNDVFSLAKRLAPTATGVRTPSYGN